MRIVNIGTDKSLVGGAGFAGNAVERHCRYGEFVESLDIIVFTRKVENYQNFVISKNVVGHPTNSSSFFFFFIDAIKVFNSLWIKNKIDIVVCQDPFFCGLVGCFLKWRYKVKLQINFHGDVWSNFSWLRERWYNFLLFPLQVVSLFFADKIRVVSLFIKQKLLKFGIGDKKISVIPTPVTFNNLINDNPEKVLQIKNKYPGKIILFVGRFERVKNIPLLIKIFELYQKNNVESYLLLVGDGQLKNKIKKQAQFSVAASKIVILDPLLLSELKNYYYAANLVVLVSRSEGLPKALVEAAFCALPLLSSEVSGAAELIKNGENGFIVNGYKAENYAQRMNEILKDENRALAMGKLSHELVISNFGDTTQKIVSLWKELTDRL